MPATNEPTAARNARINAQWKAAKAKEDEAALKRLVASGRAIDTQNRYN